MGNSSCSNTCPEQSSSLQVEISQRRATSLHLTKLAIVLDSLIKSIEYFTIPYENIEQLKQIQESPVNFRPLIRMQNNQNTLIWNIQIENTETIDIVYTKQISKFVGRIDQYMNKINTACPINAGCNCFFMLL